MKYSEIVESKNLPADQTDIKVEQSNWRRGVGAVREDERSKEGQTLQPSH